MKRSSDDVDDEPIDKLASDSLFLSNTTMSTVSTTTGRRRLSSRRGSTAAPDPYGLHADINDAPDRTSSSKLTIVRVLQQPTSPPLTLNEPPSSFTSVSRRRSYRSSGTTSPPPDGAPAGRLSFAFSSFGHEHGGGHRRESSTGSIGAGEYQLSIFD
jgi:hypothetical protein